jgi:tetratricopeptide (TPR) repeat protein
MARSDHTEGRQWLERVLQLPDTPAHPAAHAELLAQLAHHVFLQVGEQQQRPLIGQALRIARAHGDKHNTARALAMLGLNLVEEKKYAAARAALEESAALYWEVHDEWGQAHAIMCLGYGFNEQADLENALSRFEHALTLCGKIGDRFLTNVILRGLAIVHVKLNNMADALAALQESLLLAHQLESKLEVAGTLSRLGKAEQRAGNHIRAVCLLWAAKNLFDLVGAWPQRFEFDLEKDLEPCRAALGEETFAEAEAQGRAMTMEQVIQYALKEQK